MAGRETALPITPLANAFHGLLNRSNSATIQPIPFASRLRGNSISDKENQVDTNVCTTYAQHAQHAQHSTTHAQHMHNTCTTYAQHMHNMHNMHNIAQHMHNICKHNIMHHCMHQYPSIPINIHQYPSISINIHQ
jgi:hypothetical protein